MNNSSITSRTVKGMLWVFSGTGIQMVLQVVTLGVLARLVSPSDFGLVNAALIAVGFISLVANWISPAIIQRKDLNDRHIRTSFTVSVALGIGLMILTILFAPALAILLGMDNIVPIIRVSALMFLLQGIFVIPDSILSRNLRFDIQTIVQIISYILYGIVGISLAVLKWGVWALLAAQLSQVFISMLLELILQPHPKKILFDRQSFNELFYFGGGFTIARLGNYFANNGDNLVVGRWLGEEALGLYSRAFQMVVMPATLFGQVLDTVLFPAMASVQDSMDRLKGAFRRGVLFIAIVVVPVSVLCIILAPEIIRVTLGNNWNNAILPFQILALSILFRTSYKMSNSLARATGVVYNQAWRQVLFAVFIILGAGIGCHWGLAGVAWGVLGANAINFILMAQLSLKLISMTWKEFFQTQLPSLWFAVFTSLAIWSVTALMRSYHIFPVLILLVGILLMGIMMIYVLLKRPKFLLGNDLVWALDVLEQNFPVQLPLIVRKFLINLRNANP